jgi:hypothetical protein
MNPTAGPAQARTAYDSEPPLRKTPGNAKPGKGGGRKLLP